MVATDLTTVSLQDQIDADIAERTRVHQKAIARLQAASDVASSMSVSAIARPFVMLAVGDPRMTIHYSTTALPFNRPT